MSILILLTLHRHGFVEGQIVAMREAKKQGVEHPDLSGIPWPPQLTVLDPTTPYASAVGPPTANQPPATEEYLSPDEIETLATDAMLKVESELSCFYRSMHC